MHNIRGQETILNRISRLNLDTFPRTLMLLGESGSGKHSIVNIIQNTFNLRSEDITEKISLDLLDEIYRRVEPYIYIISINSISIKEENTILKFLEEPLKNSYIILLADCKDGILPTILNRCQIWTLEKYSKDFLKQLFTDVPDEVFDICTTPGQIKNMQDCDIKTIFELSEKIIEKIDQASVNNTLSLSDKIGFKSEKNKVDAAIFIKILRTTAKSYWLKNNNLKYLKAYNLTSQFCNKYKLPNLDKKMLFESYLLQLKYVMRD